MSVDPIREVSPTHVGSRRNRPYEETNPMPHKTERDIIYRDPDTGMKMSDIHPDVKKSELHGLSETEAQVIGDK